MTMISTEVIMQMIDQIVEEQQARPKVYQVKAYDEDGDPITDISGFDLEEQLFESAEEVKEKLEPAIARYNARPGCSFPVAGIAVFIHKMIAGAAIETRVTEVTTLAERAEIGEYRYTPN